MRNEDFQRLLDSVRLLEPMQLRMLADAVHLHLLVGAATPTPLPASPPAPPVAPAQSDTPAPVPNFAGGLQPTPELPVVSHAPLASTTAAIEGRFLIDPACPHCRATAIIKWGKANGLKRYRCKACEVTFNALTGTPMAHLHKRELWEAHAQELLGGGSLRTVAMHLEVHLTTSFRWRHRFLATPNTSKPKKLSGIVEADETYFLESFKGKRKLSRPARSRGGKAVKRGLSAEQIPVLIARDRDNKATTDQILANRSAGEIASALGTRIAHDAVLVSDAAKGYPAFAADAKIAHVGLNASQGERVWGIYHIQNVNAYTSRLKAWMARFKGVATAYLDTYLGWFRLNEAWGSGLDAKMMLATSIS